MINNAVAYVENFFTDLNKRFGLNVECEIVEFDRDKYPICIRDKKLTVIPEFFFCPELSENLKINLMTEMYSFFYIDKDKDGHIDINPGFMSKGILTELGVPFYSDTEMEEQLRVIRRKLYDSPEHSCYFEVGRKVRESAFVSYEVVDVVRKSPTETTVIVKPVGCNLGKPIREFSEEELFNRCCNFRDLKDERVSMRKNLYVISGPSGVGKDTVVKELRRRYPHINKTISITTRPKRSTEIDGVDYYYISSDEFYDRQLNGDFVEYELYDRAYYGTMFSEIERHSEKVPLVLVVDVRGRRNIMMRYPLAKSIFINPPSFEVLERRIRGRNENSPEEIEHRMNVAKEEMDDASSYTYQVINNDVDSCVEAIYKIITEDFKR